MNLEEIRKEAIARSEAGRPREEILKFLRQCGCSQGFSMFLLPSIFKCNMAEAKRIVFFSETWKDARVANEQLHRKMDEMTFNDPQKDTTDE